VSKTSVFRQCKNRWLLRSRLKDGVCNTKDANRLNATNYRKEIHPILLQNLDENIECFDCNHYSIQPHITGQNTCFLDCYLPKQVDKHISCNCISNLNRFTYFKILPLEHSTSIHIISTRRATTLTWTIHPGKRKRCRSESNRKRPRIWIIAIETMIDGIASACQGSREPTRSIPHQCISVFTKYEVNRIIAHITHGITRSWSSIKRIDSDRMGFIPCTAGGKLLF
jgi:hypothetical protein